MAKGGTLGTSRGYCCNMPMGDPFEQPRGDPCNWPRGDLCDWPRGNLVNRTGEKLLNIKGGTLVTSKRTLLQYANRGPLGTFMVLPFVRSMLWFN